MTDSTSVPELDQLKQVRHRLLQLHKLLLDRERAEYEQAHGSVSGNELLRLVIDDPQFAWLRSISALIVRIDEAFDGEDPLSAEDAAAFLREIGLLLQPAENGADFGQKYFAAVQADPDVVLAHREIRSLLDNGQ